MISKETIDEIMLASKIEEVVADFVTLKKRGQNYIGVCPFHQDKNPSMYVSPRLGIYNCFVCDSKGNAVNFVMNHEKMSYPEALRYLAQKYGISIKEDRERTQEEKTAITLKESLILVNTFAEQYFHDQLLNSEEGQNIGLSYFEERGIPMETIKKFKLGYCPDSWSVFTEHAIKNGYSEEFLIKLGLTKKSESGKIFDFFRGRVMFPIHNAIGKCVGFGGRTLQSDTKMAKYFNSPESEVYHKSDVLYGFHLAKKSIRGNDNVYLVEGYTDVISMHIAGVENVVASSGTALTQGQIKLIASQTKNITVIYDGDTAGIKASLRGIDLLIEHGLNVYVVPLPDGEDPDSFSRKSNDEDFQHYLQEERKHFIFFKAKVGIQDAGNDPLKKAAVINGIIHNIAHISDTIAQALYVKECAHLFQISEEDLNIQLRKKIVSLIKKGSQKENEAPPTLPPTNAPEEPPFFPPEQINPIPHTHSSLLSIEEKIIQLILRNGMFEIDIELENKQIISQRLDQYIFDELFNEELSFESPILQEIYNEYAFVAPEYRSQDELKQHFTTHPNNTIATTAIHLLIDKENDLSAGWEKKFEITTNSIDNNIFKLNKEVEGMIALFKIKILEKHISMLQQSLSKPLSEAESTKILTQYFSYIKRREELCNFIKIVVTQ